MEGVTRERWQRIVAALAVVALVVVAVRVGSSDSASVRFSDAGEWLETGVTGSVVFVSGATGEVVSRATVAEPGNSLSAVTSNGAAVVLDRNSSTVSLLSGATQDIVRSLDTEAGGSELDLLGTEEVAYLVQPSSVRVLDPATLAVLDEIEIDGFPDERVVDEAGRLWIYSADTERLHNISVDGDSSRRVATPSHLIPSGRDALLLAVGDGSFSLSQASGGSLVSCPTDAELDDLVAGSDGRFSFVATSDGATSWMFDHTSPNCASTVAVEGDWDFSVAAAEDGFGYAGDIGTGEVVSFDLRTPEFLGRDRFSVQNVGFELHALNGIVWANEPTGAKAAIFDDGELFAAVDKVGFSDSNGSKSAAGTGQSLLDADEATLGLINALEDADADTDVAVAGEQLAPEDAPESPSEPDPDGSLDANFTYSSQIAFIGEQITFSDRSSGAPTSFGWDFGDGVLGSGPEVSHAWDAEGDYVVELIVDDGESS
ncbi:MAG: PKD domain-containing protein, partial [Acidobacteria bacterium]|nr:PKD domain-containing protein [Acidobacteriota bacterium]